MLLASNLWVLMSHVEAQLMSVGEMAIASYVPDPSCRDDVIAIEARGVLAISD